MTTTRRKPAPGTVVREPSVRARIVVIRGSRVILDRDIAELYGVGTRALNQAVARNRTRFPADFAFRLTATEVSNLKSQSVTSSSHGGRRKLPRAFTEHGVAMLLWRSAQQARRSGKRGDHARLRAAPRSRTVARRAHGEDHGSRAEVRRPVRSRVRRDPAFDGSSRATRSTTTPNRIHHRAGTRGEIPGTWSALNWLGNARESQ